LTKTESTFLVVFKDVKENKQGYKFIPVSTVYKTMALTVLLYKAEK